MSAGRWFIQYSNSKFQDRTPEAKAGSEIPYDTLAFRSKVTYAVLEATDSCEQHTNLEARKDKSQVSVLCKLNWTELNKSIKKLTDRKLIIFYSS